jgi:hypothetical protein
MTTSTQVQEEILNTVRKSQETVVDAIKYWVEAVQSITPKVPSVQVPFADKLPKPQDVVSGAYDFAEKLLASQRQFAEDVLEATAALQPGKEGRDAHDAKSAHDSRNGHDSKSGQASKAKASPAN